MDVLLLHQPSSLSLSLSSPTSDPKNARRWARRSLPSARGRGERRREEGAAPAWRREEAFNKSCSDCSFFASEILREIRRRSTEGGKKKLTKKKRNQEAPSLSVSLDHERSGRGAIREQVLCSSDPAKKRPTTRKGTPTGRCLRANDGDDDDKVVAPEGALRRELAARPPLRHHERISEARAAADR